MRTQNYANHRKFHPPFHFVLVPVLLLLEVLGMRNIFTDEANQLTWILFSIIIFLLMYISLMMRQHYGLGNQNRIIRLEFKQRYFEIFGTRSDEVAEKLSFSQIAALRFAYDDEFKTLLQKALLENTPGKDIKKSIINWKPDFHRV